MLSRMCFVVDVHPVLDSGLCVLVGWGRGVRHRHCEAITACNRRWRRWTAVGVRGTDALPGPRGGAGGDGAGPGVGVDGTACVRRVRDEPAVARRAAGRRGIDDAVGAADGERGGCCANWRRSATRPRTSACASATAPNGCGGCTGIGSRTRCGSWTSSIDGCGQLVERGLVGDAVEQGAQATARVRVELQGGLSPQHRQLGVGAALLPVLLPACQPSCQSSSFQPPSSPSFQPSFAGPVADLLEVSTLREYIARARLGGEFGTERWKWYRGDAIAPGGRAVARPKVPHSIKQLMRSVARYAETGGSGSARAQPVHRRRRRHPLLGVRRLRHVCAVKRP